MKIEDITAPPPRLSPEMRYASLHRTVEGGFATDRTWTELIEVCLELGLGDEAQGSFWHVKDASIRRRLLGSMQRRKLLLDVSLGAAEGGQDSDSLRSTGKSDGGDPDSILERILDGFRFLFVDHMPMTAVVATVTFPLVVGLGGFLTSTVQSSFLLPLIALIPALSVVGLVGALGRRILVEASRGLDDPPEIPSLGALAPQAGRFLMDATVLTAIFLGPAALLTQIEQVGWSAVLAAFAVGLTMFPMAMALRQTRDDWSCLSLGTLFRAIVHGGRHYMALVATGALLFAPSFASVWLASGSHLYLILSVVGPLAVTPTFVMSRLLGQFLFVHRKVLPAHRKEVDSPVAQSARPRSGSAARSTPAPRLSRSTPRPTPAPRTALAPRTMGSMRALGHPEARPATPSAPRANVPTKRTIGTRAPVRSAVTEPRPAPAGIGTQLGTPTPRLRIRDDLTATTATHEQTSRRSRIVGEEIPDLTKMPGVSVLKGDARVAAGAAAPTRPN